MTRRAPPILGKIQAGGVIEVTGFSYVTNVDGIEDTLPAEPVGESDAVVGAQARLQLIVSLTRPAIAYVAVFRGEGDEAEPIGCWRHEPETGAMTWEPAE